MKVKHLINLGFQPIRVLTVVIHNSLKNSYINL